MIKETKYINRFLIKVIHGACAGFSLKWLPHLIHKTRSYRPFMNEKLCLLATVEDSEAISG
jgi:hypothetical protein